MAEHIEYQGNFSGSQIDTLLTKIQSSQVFTTEEKTKLASLVNYDDTEVKEDISDIETSLNSHKSDTTNPHQVTKAQVGLGNVNNTSDANKPISTATQAALDNKVNKVDGKGLSTNDFSDSEKAQISANKAGIGAVANAGAKNLMRNTASSQVVGGVTFTVNADGTIIANGTKTNNDWFYLSTGNSLAAGTYVLSSGLAPQSDMSIRLLITTVDSLGSAIMSTEGTRQVQIKQLTSDYTGLYYAIRISSGTTVNNIVFKPMLRDAAIEDSTYVPYAPTNRELYEMILALQSGS